MKPRAAIVRGPNLNRWEMQCYLPLREEFELTTFTSKGHNFPLDEIPLRIEKLFSLGQFLRSRALRDIMSRRTGDYHDLRGLENRLAGFDLVHTAETAYFCSFQAAKAKKQHGYKLVVTVWENIPFAVHRAPTAEMKRVVNQEADAFIAVSGRTKEVLLLEGAPEEKITVLMPGIDLDHFHPGSKSETLLAKFGCAERDRIVLFVANLYWEKGIFDLLVAFRRAWDRMGRPADVKLLIAGKGKEHDEVERWIDLLKIRNQTRLIGSHPYSVMPEIHRLADLFVLPSIPTRIWQEQFGYVLVESMATGTPVVSTRSGSIPEVLGDTGVLVEPNDFLGLAKVMEELLSSSPTRSRLGTLARKRAESTFDLRSVAQSLSALYHKVLRS